jgi:hypothetical protein
VSTALMRQPAPAPIADDPMFPNEVIAHLELQLRSARRLLEVVLAQGKAIRRRDVQGVVREAGMLQVEMHRRRAIEDERSCLLERAAARLRIAKGAVTLQRIAALMSGAEARVAFDRSAELQGLLGEVQREHTVNRALMSQELAFLDHLLGLVNRDGSGAYGMAASRPRAAASLPGRRVLDMQA